MASFLYKAFKLIKYKVNRLRFILRGNKLGKGTMASSKADLRNTTIGNYSYVAEYSELNCVDMGSYCSIGPSVHIGSMEHPYWKPSTSPRLYREDCISEIRTVIGNDVWIGAHCSIKLGIKIGSGAVVGANSFVNKDVPPYSIVVGSPARVLKYRFDETVIEKIQATKFWEKDPIAAKELLNQITID